MYRIRVPIGFLLLSIFFGIFYLDYSRNIMYPSQIVLGILILAALWEFYRVVEKRGYSPYRWYGMLSAAFGILLILFFFGNSPSDIQEIQYMWFVAIAMGLFLKGMLEPQEDKVLEKTFSTLTGLVYVYFLLSYLFKIRALGTPREGIIYVLFVVLVAKGTDIGGYLVGRAFGKHKIYPAISPKKSWEGWAGGLVCSLGASLGLWHIFPLLHRLTWWQAIVFGVLLSFFSLLGDFSESLVKRRCESKDSASLIPEFGGILDLMDSLIFTAPVGYYFLVWCR